MISLKKAKLLIDEEVNACAEHKAPFIGDDVIEVIKGECWCCCGVGEENVCTSYCDHGSVGIVWLKNGLIGVWWEDSDTSGHG